MSNFFENFGKKAKTVLNQAQTAVETGCERFQLSQDIKAQQLALNDFFAELGRLAYHGNAELAGVRPRGEIIADISAASAKLQALEEQYEDVTSPTEEEEPAINKDDKPLVACFCHKCGTPQPDENDFCHKCGTKLNK